MPAPNRSVSPCLFLAGLFALSSVGCSSKIAEVTSTSSGGSETLPALMSTTEFLTSGAGAEALVGQYEVIIDLERLQATAELVPARHTVAQPPQALTYDLDIDQFLTREGFQIESLAALPDGNLELTFLHSHPFPAPDFNAAISGTNRADLGYTGRLLVYADTESISFFNDEIRLDPSLVVAPDGFMQPLTLALHAPAGSNNAFPYVLLADEAKDNRLDITNGGNPSGNYDPAQGGWSRANADGDGRGWTGFDFIHGGQTIRQTLVLNRTALASGGTASFRVGILIKYTDPRGSGGRSRRFPVEPPIATEFAYRLPFAALDASVVVPPDDFAVSTEPGVDTPIAVLIRDWDASAEEAPAADLSGEANVELVPPDTSGTGTLRLELPALFAAPVTIPRVGGTGGPDDPLLFAASLDPDFEPPAGETLAALEYIDPEDAGADATYHFGVDPLTLAADPGRALHLRTYYVFPVSMYRDAPQITGVDVEGNISREAVTFTATTAGSPITEWEWDFGGGVNPNDQVGASPLDTVLGAPGTWTGTLTVRNAAGEDSFDFNYTTVARAMGLDVIVVRSGALYPTLWPGVPNWSEASVENYLIPRFNAVYEDAGLFLDPALVTVTEIDDPIIFQIDSLFEFNQMWVVLLNHSKPYPQLMVIKSDNWFGFAGIMRDLTCDWDNAGRGAVVTSGWNDTYTTWMINHELGHIFTLPHIRTTTSPQTPNNFNLMSYGPNDTSMSEAANREATATCNSVQDIVHNQFQASHTWVHDYTP